MPNLVIRNCDVLRSDNGSYQIVAGQDILISGNHIQSIAPTGTTLGDEQAEIFSAQGMLAIPGLINTHAHVPNNRKANLIYTIRPNDIDTVICDGQFLLVHGKHTTIDKERVVREILPRLERLTRKSADKKMADYPT